MGESEGRRGGVPHRRATQRMVAEHAGVSAQTVSRVANDMLNVDEDTRQRVLLSMNALGYRVNRAGLALRSGQYRTIGVVMSTLSSYGNARTWESLAVAADRAGYSAVFVAVDGPDPDSAARALERLGEQPVDGVAVLIERHLLGGDALDLPPDLPVVLIDSAGQPGRPPVDTDQAQGARQATEHLLSLGHATVHHVAGPRESFAAERREQAWRAALIAHGAPVPDVVRGDWGAESGFRAAQQICGAPGVSAIFAANDHMALGVLNAAHERGLRIPDDLSVVGFDDLPEASRFWPPLTTVRQDFARVGRVAVETLLAVIHGEQPASPPIVPTELILRASTARPPRRNT